MENLQVWYIFNSTYKFYYVYKNYYICTSSFWKLLLVSRSIQSKVQNLEKLWSSLKVQIWFHKNCECLIPGNHSFHSCIITSIVHIFMFYRKKFILMRFLLVSMCDSVGGTHHESREKLKSSMSTTTTSEKSKQTSKGKSSHSTGGSENSPKRVQSGSVL